MDVKQGGLGSRAQAAARATPCTVLFLTVLDNTVVSAVVAVLTIHRSAGQTYDG
jgi:hypothetical protein